MAPKNKFIILTTCHEAWGKCVVFVGFVVGVGSGWLNWVCGGSSIVISVCFGVGVVGWFRGWGC